MLSPKFECPANVLVVDDEQAMQTYTRALLEPEGYQVETVSSGADALFRVRQGQSPDVVLLDLLMPGLDGLQTLEQMHQVDPALKVVMLSCVSDSRKIVEAIRLGAADYISKPFRKDDLQNVLQPLLVAPPRQQPSTGELSEDLGDGVFFVTATPEMHKLRAQAELVAQVDIPVLLLGESGTGKEIFARIIHVVSPRAHGPFLKVNCAALPEDLLESELFGYEPGAFTGATQVKPGKFELCNKGTILLDEIGEMSPSLQAKLLHVLQDQQFSRLGGRSVIQTDVRVIAATNVPIKQAIATKRLREDLYYRLSGFTFRLPPLRERKADIAILLRHFMATLAERYACPALPISLAEMEVCMSYPWPGNVREMENFIKRCLVLQEFTPLISQHPLANGGRAMESAGRNAVNENGLKSLSRSARQDAEVCAIIRALDETSWNRKQAAERLKISYKALLYKIREYEIEPPTGSPL
jgi:two-component system, NtrC family, response regulator AtoC